MVRLIKGNPSYKFNINVTLLGLQKDSVKSNPDLTEIQRDTTHTLVTDRIVSHTIPNDSLSTPADSVTTVTRDSIAVKITYHNDRTSQQAESVRTYLIAQGILEANLTTSHNAFVEALPENRRTKVRLTVRQ